MHHKILVGLLFLVCFCSVANAGFLEPDRKIIIINQAATDTNLLTEDVNNANYLNGWSLSQIDQNNLTLFSQKFDVLIIHLDGSKTYYKSLLESDTGRGTVLVTAIGSVAVGDLVLVGPGVFDIGNDTVLALPDGNRTNKIVLTGVGKDKTIIKSGANILVPTNAIIATGSNTVVSDLTVWGTSNSYYQYPIGIGDGVSADENIFLYNLKIIADTDGIMVYSGGKSSMEVHNVEIYTKWDAVRVLSSDTTTVNIYDSYLEAKGPSLVGTNGLIHSVAVGSKSTLRIYNSKLMAKNGGNAAGGYTTGTYTDAPTAVIELINSSVESSSVYAGKPVYSLFSQGGGTVKVSNSDYNTRNASVSSLIYLDNNSTRQSIENALLGLTGLAKLTTGVFGVALAGTDYTIPSDLNAFLKLTGGDLNGNLNLKQNADLNSDDVNANKLISRLGYLCNDANCYKISDLNKGDFPRRINHVEYHNQSTDISSIYFPDIVQGTYRVSWIYYVSTPDELKDGAVLNFNYSGPISGLTISTDTLILNDYYTTLGSQYIAVGSGDYIRYGTELTTDADYGDARWDLIMDLERLS